MNDHNTRKFYDMLEAFDVVMLVTRSNDGELRARPMALVDTDKRGHIWLITDRDAAKVHEIGDDPRISLTAQAHGRYLSLSGLGEVHDDPEAVREHATDRMVRWLDELEPNREVVMIHIVPQHGEYWDDTGDKHISWVYESLRHYATDSTTQLDRRDYHGKVSL